MAFAREAGFGALTERGVAAAEGIGPRRRLRRLLLRGHGGPAARADPPGRARRDPAQCRLPSRSSGARGRPACRSRCTGRGRRRVRRRGPPGRSARWSSTADRAELFLYPGEGHLFPDSPARLRRGRDERSSPSASTRSSTASAEGSGRRAGLRSSHGGRAGGGGAARATPRDPAAAPHPRGRDRRRRGDGGAVRPAAGDLRRLHRLGAGAGLPRGLHPRRGAAALRQHPHRVQRHRPADHPPARGRAGDHPRRGRGRRRHRRDLRGVGLHRRRRQADRRARPAHPVGPRGPLPPQRRRSRRERAAGGLHRPLRAPLQRDAVARVDRRRGRRSRPTPTGTSTSRVLEAELVAPRRPAAQDRQLLRRLQRHRHPQRHRRHLDAAAPPRRAVVLGLRGRRALRQDRDGRPRRRRPALLQGRRLPLAAQVHRRARRRPACSSYDARC